MGDEASVATYPIESDDLIVGLPERDEVLKVLTEFGVESPSVKNSPLLGLSRITLPNPRNLADAVAGALPTDDAKALLAQRRATDQPIDDVLRGLRALFKRRYARWSPRLGKNRLVGHLQGVGEISHGGTGDPVPASAPDSVSSPRPDAPGEGVRVGVLDTGVYPHPRLAGGWVSPSSSVVVAGAVLPYLGGHATFVTGLILGQAPGAAIEVRRVLPDDDGGPGPDSWAVAEAIVRAGGTGLDVLNLSFVCYTEDGEPPLVLATAIDRLPADLVVVAAAGNHADTTSPEPGQCPQAPECSSPAWPAALDGVLAVGAGTQAGGLVPFSPAAPWIDLRTEGGGVTSTYLPTAKDATGTPVAFSTGYATWSGTSFAAARVSGAIAARTKPGRFSAMEALEQVKQSPGGFLTLPPSV